MNIKRILVPTAFSAQGKTRSDFALMLAPEFNSELHLLTRVYLHPLWYSLTTEEKQASPESG